MKQKIKAVLFYCGVLAAGLAVGAGVAKLPKLLERPYQQGNFTGHYAAAQSKVVVYGTASCPYCAKTREYLAQRKVAFADLYVEKSDDAKQKYASLNVKGVPAILIGDRLISGFKPDVIDAALQAISK